MKAGLSRQKLITGVWVATGLGWVVAYLRRRVFHGRVDSSHCSREVGAVELPGYVAAGWYTATSRVRCYMCC